MAEMRDKARAFRAENVKQFTSYKHHYVLNEGEDWDEAIVDEVGLAAAFATEIVEECAQVAEDHTFSNPGTDFERGAKSASTIIAMRIREKVGR